MTAPIPLYFYFCSNARTASHGSISRANKYLVTLSIYVINEIPI